MPTACIFLHSCEHCVHATVYSAFYHMYYVLNIWQIAIVITAVFNNCENSMEWMGYNILSCSLIINKVFSAPLFSFSHLLFLSPCSSSIHLLFLLLQVLLSFPPPFPLFLIFFFLILSAPPCHYR